MNILCFTIRTDILDDTGQPCYTETTKIPEVQIMRFLLKILFAPIIALFAVIVRFSAFLLSLSSFVFGLMGILFAVCGLITLLIGFIPNGIAFLIAAFLVSPYGLPMLALRLLGGVENLRLAILNKFYR